VSGSYGCGEWDSASGEWIQLECGAVDRQARMEEESICAKELLPIVLACVIWERCWVEQVVQVSCGNTGLVTWEQSQLGIQPVASNDASTEVPTLYKNTFLTGSAGQPHSGDKEHYRRCNLT